LEHPFYKYVEQSRVVERPLPRGKPKSGPLGLDSLLAVKRNVQVIYTKIQFGRDPNILVTYLLFDGVLFVLNFGHWYLELEISMILFNKIISVTPNSYLFI